MVFLNVAQALRVRQEVNCLTDFLEECEEQLRALKKLKKSERGLLYGVPISLKDVYDCMGHDSTCGLAQFLEKPAAKDGVIVKVLKAHGAIPFVKTNIPQTLFDCSNPIYGQTLNPLNLKKTPGGSSGGEGALLAKGGSILGMGTDTGGSVRIPPSFCGFCGLRTTGYRSAQAAISTHPQPLTRGWSQVAGPMAKDVESLALCLRVLLSEDMHRLDATVPPLPFREEVYSSNRPLRIGYYESDNFTQPSPSMLRAVRLTSKLLQDAGYQVGLLSRQEGGEAGPVRMLGWSILGKKGISTRLPVRSLVSLSGLRIRCCHELWCRSQTRLGSRVFIAKWRSLDLDVLLAPALDPAFYIGYPAKAGNSSSYMALFNILNFPAGVVPVTTVTPQDEEELAFYRGYYGDISDKNFQEAVRGSVGLPVAVQCIALPWEEELCLRFMKEVETLVKNQGGRK
uniref:Amidase domain-containing protein n=1 Tax=Catagonus wagneri TaxID=51154 RepID=A0A8C3WEP1_9CETA